MSRKYLVMGAELQELFKGAYHIPKIKGQHSPPKITMGTVKGRHVMLVAREVMRNGLDGLGTTVEIRSKVDGKTVNRRRLLELCGEIETKPPAVTQPKDTPNV